VEEGRFLGGACGGYEHTVSEVVGEVEVILVVVR
jgi:hypothetical protein